MKTVSVLFARRDSVYKTLPGADVWDEERNAVTWCGGKPVIAHPPCRLWGRLRKFSTAEQAEKQLAILAVHWVRKYGGVLEHPEASSLWAEMNMALPDTGTDEHGGWTISVDQSWWGFPTRKVTWLYIVGCLPHHLPPMPRTRGNSPTHAIRSSSGGRLPLLPKSERDRTTVDFARWLLRLARACSTGTGPRWNARTGRRVS